MLGLGYEQYGMLALFHFLLLLQPLNRLRIPRSKPIALYNITKASYLRNPEQGADVYLKLSKAAIGEPSFFVLLATHIQTASVDSIQTWF